MTLSQRIQEFALEKFGKEVEIVIGEGIVTATIDTQLGPVTASALFQQDLIDDGGSKPTVGGFIASNVLGRLQDEIIQATL